MPIKTVKTPKTEEEIAQENKPLLNIQLPAPTSGDPNTPLSISRHNTAAQHNFQEVANILMTIINNQKIMGMAIGQITEKQKELEENTKSVSENIRKLLNKKDDKPNNAPTTTNK